MTSKGRKKLTSKRIMGQLKPQHRKKKKKDQVDWWIEDAEETEIKMPKLSIKQRILQRMFG